MANIERVTFESAAEKLREQIKTAFVELIPEDQWNDMVRKELDQFFHGRKDSPDYEWINGKKCKVDYPSRFHVMVREAAEAECKERVKQVIHLGFWRPDKGSLWEYGHFATQVEKLVKAWLSDNAKMLVKVMIESMIGDAAENILSHVASKYARDKYPEDSPIDYNDPNDPRNPSGRCYRGW